MPPKKGVLIYIYIYSTGLLYYFTDRIEDAKKQRDILFESVGDSDRYRDLSMLFLEEERINKTIDVDDIP